MYTKELPECRLSTTLVSIKYDCCGKEHVLKWKDADKNFKKNGEKHICRPCWLKSDANPAKNKDNIEKAKRTNLERYGTTQPLNTPELISQRSEKFKDEEFVKQWNEKRRQTSLEKYGVEHPIQSEEVKNKQRETMRLVWGVDNPLQNEEIKAKVKKTCLERYGVENPAQSPEIMKKAHATTKERYGVEHYNELPEMREYLRKHCREWLAESWANPWSKGITRPEEWNRKQSETMAKRIMEGNIIAGYLTNIRGRFPAIKCRKENPPFLSSLELIFHFYLNANLQVEWYDYQPFSIPYFHPEKKGIRSYLPDFLVKFKNMDSLNIFETKTWRDKQSNVVFAKTNAGIKYADEHGMIYNIIFDEDVRQLGIPLEVAKNVPGIIFHEFKK